MAQSRENEREALKLRELFRGRFDQDVAERLIADLGGLMQAVDFIMTEPEDQVARCLKQSPEYLQSMRTDSAKVATILNNGIESSVRQFACGDCNRAWWRRVPVRKEVSRCRRCRVKYDPIPHDKEWGVGKFFCPCGNEFTGSAVMGMTRSECYKCGLSVPVSKMVPPRRNRPRKTNKPHSCDADNCYNLSQGHDAPGPLAGVGLGWLNADDEDDDDDLLARNIPGIRDHGQSHGSGGQADDSQAAGAYPGPHVCIHPKSAKPPNRRIRTASQRHISTGSTVGTFLTQGSLDTDTVSIAFTMETIDED